jgi:hypothetical protein
MPHVAPGESLEGNDDARNHSRIRAYRVFPAALRGRGRERGPGEADRPLVLELVGVERTAVEYLKFDQVNVDRM